MYEKNRLTSPEQGSQGMDGLIQAQIAAFLPTEQLGRVLDYGAGNSPYRHLLACDLYVAADISQNLAGDIDHLIVPGEKLPIQDRVFDLVLLLDVLEHVVDPNFVLGEIRRLLDPNGRLIISIPFMYREHETPNDFARYTVFGIHELLRRQNGKVLRIRKLGNIYYTLMSLFLERGVFNGEQNCLGYKGRVVNRAFRFMLPVLAPLLRKPPGDDEGIYHHLLVEVCFS